MNIESIRLQGFRCFGPTAQTVLLDDLTCFVGPNASGKTAIMMAMSRIFGENQAERVVRGPDFFLSPGEKLDDVAERVLSIEVKLSLPELALTPPAGAAIPETFNQMVAGSVGGTPYCRARLDATWTRDGSPAGDTQQRLWWVTTTSDDPAVVAENQHGIKPADRARIRVVYVPAARDPAGQIHSATTTAFGRLLAALDWGGKDADLKQRLVELKGELGQLQGIGPINTKVQAAWRALYDGRVASNVSFEAVDADPAALLDLLVPVFAPDQQGTTSLTTELSDGLRSLFSLSLPLGMHRIEQMMKADAAGAGFQALAADKLPLLTLFAVEEPENHLSPHYLGKVITELTAVAVMPNAQVMVSSHSPSIMSRVKPDNVRYMLGGEHQAATEVRQLALPQLDQDEAFKYVREAVRGHPELYFSRLVILGEGASEEVVLRRLFEVSGTPLDAHFISIVPLGGRHVNHFWRLLADLRIPYITLLDLDAEKEGAGWGRIQYVRDQLLLLYPTGSARGAFTDPTGAARTLDEGAFDALHQKDDRLDAAELRLWVQALREQYDVFFSAPLDLDFAMLEAFPTAYRSQHPPGGGPRLPPGEPERAAAAKERMRQVLASDPGSAPPALGASYGAARAETFAWYKYLFVDGSKPVAHMRANVSLADADWLASAPEFLAAIQVRAKALVEPLVDPLT